MPNTSNAISCKLNQDFVKIRKASKFKVKEKQITGTYGAYNILQITDGKHEFRYGTSGSCCGITEFTFYNLGQELAKLNSELTDSMFASLVAGWMQYQAKCSRPSRRDNRIVFCGLPMQVKRASMYDVKFYKRLHKLLLSWGFVQVHQKPYTNGNSNNKIVVLVGQMPK